MYISKDKLKVWYKENLEKIALVFIILVAFTLTIVYIPYLNVFFSPTVGFLITFLIWYLLFMPTVSLLVRMGVVSLGVGLIATLLELNFLAETIGEFLYVLLVLVVINFVKDFLSSSESK